MIYIKYTELVLKELRDLNDKYKHENSDRNRRDLLKLIELNEAMLIAIERAEEGWPLRFVKLPSFERTCSKGQELLYHLGLLNPAQS